MTMMSDDDNDNGHDDDDWLRSLVQKNRASSSSPRDPHHLHPLLSHKQVNAVPAAPPMMWALRPYGPAEERRSERKKKKKKRVGYVMLSMIFALTATYVFNDNTLMYSRGE